MVMKYYKNLSTELKKRATAGASNSAEVSNLSNSLKQKEKELLALKKEKEDLEKSRAEAQLAKDSLIVRTEVQKIAKKLNVRDNAIDPVLSLIGNRFSVKDNAVVVTENPESQAEEVLKEWLADKDYFLAPQVAPSANLTPAPSGPLPVAQKNIDLATPEGIKNFLTGGGTLFKKSR